MKTVRKNIAFTLIEMLVVMVIIVVLVGLLFPVVQMAKTQAEQSRARESVNQMAAAFRAYFVEIGRCPSPPAAAFYSGGAPAGSADFYLTTNIFANSSGITFYDYSTKDVVSNATYNGLLVDPWKNAYRCRMDTNYTGSVTDPLDPSLVLQWSYAIWSMGPDGTNDTAGDNSVLNKDNPRSW